MTFVCFIGPNRVGLTYSQRAVESPQLEMKAELSLLARCTACLVLAWVALLHAQPVAVRVPEAPARTVLALSSRDGAPLATGQLVQTVAGARVTSHLTFRFADGSIHDETTIFSQAGVFRLLSYHLTQSGPSFRWALDMTLDMETGRVVVRHTERDGTEEVEDEILPRHTRRHQGGARRAGRCAGAARRQTAAGHARLDSRG